MGTLTSDTPTTSPAVRGATLSKRSRAVLRDVEPGSTVECQLCGERIKFQAKVRPKQVICNVYIDDRWARVEHFHAECYEVADRPHGPVDTTPVVKARRSAANATATSGAA